MILSTLLRSIEDEIYDPKKHHVTAIVLAGGVGSRMGSETTKQMMILREKPVIVHTLLAFEQCDAVRDVVVVAKADEVPLYDELREKWALKKISRVVSGGERRQDSALEGFKVIADDTEAVLIHDGARCLVTPEIIEKVARAALSKGAAIAAERVFSTVKKVGKVGLIEETLDRDAIWLAQTPQGFRTETYRAAAYLHLKKNGGEVTDDAMLCEESDLAVFVVDGGQDNIKITTARDLTLAEIILDERAKEAEKAAEMAARTHIDRAADRQKRKEARQP